MMVYLCLQKDLQRSLNNIFKREKEGFKLTFMANLSNKEVSFTSSVEGELMDYLSGKTLVVSTENPQTFKPWEFKILIK